MNHTYGKSNITTIGFMFLTLLSACSSGQEEEINEPPFLVDIVSTEPDFTEEKSINNSWFNDLQSIITSSPKKEIQLDTAYTYDNFHYTFKKVKVDSRDYYLVQGDILLTPYELHDYIKNIRKRRVDEEVFPPRDIIQPKGVIMRYEKTKKYVRWKNSDIPLKYCFNKKSLGTSYSKVIRRFERAKKEWEDISPVKFEHVTLMDSMNLTEPNSKVDFIIKMDDSVEFDATAFFPNTEKSRRKIILNTDILNSTDGYTFDGILRHEIGHILGLRHEHIRKEAPSECDSELLDDTKPIGDYDSESCMHYFCGGAGSLLLKISDGDKLTIKELYK